MPTADAVVTLNPHDWSVAYAQNPNEFQFLADKAEELGYLEAPYGENPIYRLSLNGWKHVAELSRKESKSNQAFVAMSFDPALRPIYLDGIKPALIQTGYVPLRVDEVHYNEKIDDRLIADIRKSSLVIADFTQHKGEV
jgi:hypothetical protein